MPTLIKHCNRCNTDYSQHRRACPTCDLTLVVKYKCNVCSTTYWLSPHASECEARHRDSERTGINWSDARPTCGKEN